MMLASTAAVDERSVDAARKTLAGKGIFRVQINSRGCSFGLPWASAISKTCGPECPIKSAPAPAAVAGSRPAPIAGPDLPAQATAVFNAGRNAAPGPAIGAPGTGSTSTPAG